ncbi:MAG TPA: choice-of-anchor tandem repeat GloVer-containing protein [Candidatus Sulfotelmatobacter sp.]|nr:choice-of-anchor tandem repeat GloVer-containing protein [Candidatus Sulfotelmatobacter sp.]
MLRTKILCGYLCLTLLCSLTLAIPSAAQTYTVVTTFNGSDGSVPLGSLVQGFDGNLYGTTAAGGINSGAVSGGTIFKITPQGALTTIYEFCSQSNCSDGRQPTAGLTLGTDGNFYGTTTFGGANGEGSVFRVTPQGVLKTLHSFCAQSNCPDGARPLTGLVLGDGGNFLGTTSDLTTSSALPSFGTVFRITPQGQLTTLHRFCSLPNCADGRQPSGLIQVPHGNFWGTTGFSGQIGTSSGAPGTIFRISGTGSFATVHTFCQQANCADGEFPSGLIQANDGNFYGTTEGGGSAGAGSVFKTTVDGVFTTIYNFCSQSNCADGSGPRAGLTQGTEANFYGTTTSGGSRTGGTLFRLTPTGTITVLNNFANLHQSHAAPFQATNGSFYGTVEVLDPSTVTSFGLIYRASTGQVPFVETVQKSGVVGSTVIILGNHLTGATAVSIGDQVATFTIVSDTEIDATIPIGAQGNGPIQVIGLFPIPGGEVSSLFSNLFQVFE